MIAYKQHRFRRTRFHKRSSLNFCLGRRRPWGTVSSHGAKLHWKHFELKIKKRHIKLLSMFRKPPWYIGLHNMIYWHSAKLSNIRWTKIIKHSWNKVHMALRQSKRLNNNQLPCHGMSYLPSAKSILNMFNHAAFFPLKLNRDCRLIKGWVCVLM